MKQNIIIDTDPGIDDAMALMLAIKSKKFDILAITTVAGNVGIENTTANTRKILEILGSNIPVYSGAKKPLKKPQIKAQVHGDKGLGKLIHNTKPNLTKNAIEKLNEILIKNKNVTIVTLGPLTNIALLIKKYPKSTKRIKKIVMMGGSIDEPGNRSKVAEFNFYFDPHAARIVFESDIPKYLVPLDACHKVIMQENEFKKIREPLKTPINKMLQTYISKTKKYDSLKGAIMYDPLTIYYLLNPKTAKTEKLNIEIETESKKTEGMSIAEKRPKYKSIAKPNCEVIIHIPKKTFVNDFVRILNN